MTDHPHFCDCLDCMGGGAPTAVTRVYQDETPGPVAQELAPHGDMQRLESLLDSAVWYSPARLRAAWDAKAKEAGLSRRAWMRRVLNEAAGVK
jgi:hypothetical protein